MTEQQQRDGLAGELLRRLTQVGLKLQITRHVSGKENTLVQDLVSGQQFIGSDVGMALRAIARAVNLTLMEHHAQCLILMDWPSSVAWVYADAWDVEQHSPTERDTGHVAKHCKFIPIEEAERIVGEHPQAHWTPAAWARAFQLSNGSWIRNPPPSVLEGLRKS
jgi:hypothetical protein